MKVVQRTTFYPICVSTTHFFYHCDRRAAFSSFHRHSGPAQGARQSADEYDSALKLAVFIQGELTPEFKPMELYAIRVYGVEVGRVGLINSILKRTCDCHMIRLQEDAQRRVVCEQLLPLSAAMTIQESFLHFPYSSRAAIPVVEKSGVFLSLQYLSMMHNVT